MVSANHASNNWPQSCSNRFLFREINTHEVKDIIMGLDVNKSSIGVALRCIKLACLFVNEELIAIYNQSLQQGTVPDLLKISKITSIDKGVVQLSPLIIDLLQLYQYFPKYLKSSFLTNLATMQRRETNY